MVGVGYVDSAQRLMHVCEFSDSEGFTNLEALIVQLSPRECIYGDAAQDVQRLKQVNQRMEVI